MVDRLVITAIYRQMVDRLVITAIDWQMVDRLDNNIFDRNLFAEWTIIFLIDKVSDLLIGKCRELTEWWLCVVFDWQGFSVRLTGVWGLIDRVGLQINTGHFWPAIWFVITGWHIACLLTVRLLLHWQQILLFSRFLADWPTDWLTDSPIHSLAHLSTHSFTHSLIDSRIDSLIHRLTRLFIHLINQPINQQIIHSLTHSLIHTLNDSLSRQHTHSPSDWVNNAVTK